MDLSSVLDSRLAIAAAVEEIRAGRMVLLLDDEDRENEADLCLAAQFATSEAINFIAHVACGLICVALTGERLDALHLPLAPTGGIPLQGTAFTLSVDARYGTTTGISTQDRALTIRTLIHPDTQPHDLVSPGHVFPLRARPGGVLERRGHTEAAVDLMRLAGLEPGAVICEVLDENGEAARGARLQQLAAAWQLKAISVATIAHYLQKYPILSDMVSTRIPSRRADG